ncbi:MAG: hypothetical protein K2N22_02735 [Clostridia bacterium]|nr:hypothetical protein [Clostridia bacterium]
MKTKSRNLLTVILAVLCAAAVALGIGFLLPKAEKINASAVTISPSYSLINIDSSYSPGPYIHDGYTLGNQAGEGAASINLTQGYMRFSISVTVPAYTEYTVSYDFRVMIGLNGSFINGGSNVVVEANLFRYEDASYSTRCSSLPDFSKTASLCNADKFSFSQCTVSNLIFANNDSTSKVFKTYFSLEGGPTFKSESCRSGFGIALNPTTSTAVVSGISEPEVRAGDALTVTYDGDPHTVNFTYAKETETADLDGNMVKYKAYNAVLVTIDALNSSGISTSNYTLTCSDGVGSITATDAGTYKVKFNIKSGAACEWGMEGGGTGEKTIVLTINKKDPTVNPDIGIGPFYANNSLTTDVSITTTAGDTPGTIAWDSGQTLAAGTNNYGWTFTPTDTNNYNSPKTGTASITVAGIEIDHITATFNQGSNKYYTSSSLDDMKARLAVDKVYNDSTTARLADADYSLGVDGGGALVAGTNTILVTYTSSSSETPGATDFTDTFTVEITAVEITAITATFNPGSNDIYLSNSLDYLNHYLTVTGTYNDGSTKTLTTSDYSITDPAALALGTVTVTVASTEDSNITDTFTVNVIPDIVPVALPLPETNAYTYSGEELDAVGALTTLTDEQVVKYLDVSGTATARRAGEYTAKFKIKDEFINAGTVSWDTSNLNSLDGVTVSSDGNSVEFKWTILKAKVAATWDEEECVWVPVIVGTLAETTEPDFLTQTYTNSDGKAFTNRSKLAGGRTYQVTAAINAKYADNFELDEPTQTLINSGSETYTYTPEYKPSIWEKIVAFFKANWLWFLIALAAIILLIIIIVVAKKCHKTKEQKEEIKARKEEERRRKEEERLRREEERRLQQERLEEERRLQREKLEAEREMARAKQEAELEKIRAQAQAQAGLAGAGMASMAMAQQPAQQIPPVQQVQSVDNELLREMRQQMAELRADNKATQAQLQAMQNSQNLQQQMPQPMQQPMYQQYPQYPMYQQPIMPQYGGNDLAMARMEAQLNAMQAEQRARYDAEQRIELAAMRAESHVDRDSRHSVDLAAMREHINGHNYNRVPDYSQQSYNQPNSMDMMGALVAATLRNMANGELAATQSVPELPQKTETTTPAAKYPSDAVITTTTTVDTTKNKPIRREEDFDVDGFYDTFE